MFRGVYEDVVKSDDNIVRFNKTEKAILLNAVSFYINQIDSTKSLEDAVYNATCQSLFAKLINIFQK